MSDPHKKRHGHCKEGQGNEKKKQRHQDRPEGKFKAQEKVGHRLQYKGGKCQIDGRSPHAKKQAIKLGLTVGKPATKIIAARQRDQGRGNLSRPNEVGGAKKGREHLGPQDLNNENHSTIDGCG